MTDKIYQTPQNWLTLEECEFLYNRFRVLLQTEEPIPEFNTRFAGKLESIIGSVNQTYEGEYLNHSILEAAASYFFQFINGHPFENGNKRMAVMFTHVFLLRNNIDFSLSFAELFNTAVFVAKIGTNDKNKESSKNLARQVIKVHTTDLKI